MKRLIGLLILVAAAVMLAGCPGEGCDTQQDGACIPPVLTGT